MERSNSVSEAVYEELKMMQATGETCVLQFRTGNGGTATVATKLTDVFEDEEGQYLLTVDGLTLHLHKLIGINGKPLALFC